MTVRTYGRLYSTAPLGNLAAWIMTWYPTQSHYPDAELTSPCPILIMQNAKLGRDKCQFCKSVVWFDSDLNSIPSKWEAFTLVIRPPRLVHSRFCTYPCWRKYYSNIFQRVYSSKTFQIMGFQFQWQVQRSWFGKELFIIPNYTWCIRSIRV